MQQQQAQAHARMQAHQAQQQGQPQFCAGPGPNQAYYAYHPSQAGPSSGPGAMMQQMGQMRPGFQPGQYMPVGHQAGYPAGPNSGYPATRTSGGAHSNDQAARYHHQRFNNPHPVYVFTTDMANKLVWRFVINRVVVVGEI